MNYLKALLDRIWNPNWSWTLSMRLVNRKVDTLENRITVLETAIRKLELRDRATYYIPLTNQWHSPPQKFDPNE